MNLSKFQQKITKSAVFAALIVGATHAGAITLSYWEVDNNFSPTTGSVTGSLNAQSGTGAGNYSSVGATPTYVNDVPGAIITAGVGGNVLNDSNTHSLQFVNPGMPTVPTSNAGGKVTITGTTFQLSTFTIEGFIKSDGLADYTSIFSFNRGGGSTWMLDTDGSTGRLRVRADTDGSTGGVNNSNRVSTGADNKSVADGQWHHIALSYDGSRFYAYVDYKLVLFDPTTSAPGWDAPGGLVYTAADLTIGAGGGGRGLNALIDEVRISTTAITTDEMLRALPIPEPTTALLSAVGLLALLRRKRD